MLLEHRKGVSKSAAKLGLGRLRGKIVDQVTWEEQLQTDSFATTARPHQLKACVRQKLSKRRDHLHVGFGEDVSRISPKFLGDSLLASWMERRRQVLSSREPLGCGWLRSYPVKDLFNPPFLRFNLSTERLDAP
jgi:hypothetical protein